MGYRVHRDNNAFKIVEVNNGEVKDIMTDIAEDEARKYASNLNFGGGFDGKTPDFFLQRFAVSV
jgi:hypothetical protein